MGVSPTSIALEMEFAGAGNGWTNVIADVRAQVPVVCTYGIQSGGGPGDRCAQPGSLTFALGSGSTLGYYSPGHASARSGFDIGIGVRLTIVSASVTYTKFVGRLAVLAVEPNVRGSWLTLCTAYDYLDECLRTTLKRVAVQTGKRGDEIYDVIIAAMPSAPGSTTSGTGRETYALALDARSPEEGLSVLGELQKLAMSEAGYVYGKGTVTAANAQAMVYESRTERATKNTAQTSFDDDDLQGITVTRSRETVINSMKVRTHPRRKDSANVVLYTMRDAAVSDDSALYLTAGSSLTFTCPYTDPDNRNRRVAGTSMVTPAITTDYLANANADGSSTNLSSSLGVSMTFGGTSAVAVLTNNHASSSLYVTKFALRGLGIYDEQTSLHEQEDAASQAAFGQRTYIYDATYQLDPAKGDSFARHFLGVYKDAQQSAESVTILANRSAALMLAALAREPGDRIDISETQSAIDEGYFIQSVTLTITPASRIVCSWGLTPASRIRYWLIGTAGASEVGTNTVIGF